MKRSNTIAPYKDKLTMDVQGLNFTHKRQFSKVHRAEQEKAQ